MKRWKIAAVSFRPPSEPPVRPLDLSGGWVEIWEHGRYLGLLDSYKALELFVCRRPDRRFAARFIQRETDGTLMPIGSFGARTVDGQMKLFSVHELNGKGGKP